MFSPYLIKQGPDSISAEAFLYGMPRLIAHILFSWFLEYGYLPGDFARSIIIPLVRNKSGDLTDAENYRAIMISNAITKLLEFVLYDKLVIRYDTRCYFNVRSKTDN